MKEHYIMSVVYSDGTQVNGVPDLNKVDKKDKVRKLKFFPLDPNRQEITVVVREGENFVVGAQVTMAGATNTTSRMGFVELSQGEAKSYILIEQNGTIWFSRSLDF